MQRIKIIGLVAVLALVAAACGSGDDDEPAGHRTTDGAAPTGGHREHRGAVASSGRAPMPTRRWWRRPWAPWSRRTRRAGTSSWLRSRGPNQDLDQATIDKAMECWSNQECDTGTGGEMVMGYADGGGDTVNVWRAVSHMEAILQALTYPEIGAIVSTEANFNPDPAVHANDIRFLIQRGVDFIVGYPDMGVAIADAILEADARGSRTSRSRRAGSVSPIRKAPSSPVRTT